MRPRARLAISILLVVGGVALCAFYWLLFAIADCSADCVARGERAVPLALVAAGAGLVAAGLLLRRGALVAVSWGCILAGALGALATGWIMASEGARGMAIWLFSTMAALLGMGVAMRFAWRPS